MQIGNQYAYRALFEELESEKVILRYKGHNIQQHLLFVLHHTQASQLTCSLFQPIDSNIHS